MNPSLVVREMWGRPLNTTSKLIDNSDDNLYLIQKHILLLPVAMPIDKVDLDDSKKYLKTTESNGV